MDCIKSFSKEFDWLSNFYSVPIELDGMWFDSVEAAFQAAKTLDKESRAIIQRAPTAGKAKRLGRSVVMRPDWNEIRLSVMESLLRQKFHAGGWLALKLVETGDAMLIEGNQWHDDFWGVCSSQGKNHLGLLLMKIRNDLRS